MIYLYVKTHNVTGLKYFGKTTKEDPIKYSGSGKYWKRHLKKHGFDFSTEIVGEFEDPKLCQEIALKFSMDNDIVNNEDWANLIEENGLDGAPIGNIISDRTKNKISKSLLGKPSTKSSYKMKESHEERSSRMMNISKDTIWINNGIETRRIKSAVIPAGWVLGRIPGTIGDKNLGAKNINGNNTKGKKIYNNGSRHAYFIEGKEPDGWVRGKMDGYQGGTGNLKKGKTYEKNAS